MSFLSFLRPKTVLSKDLRIVFHRDARGLGMHGQIRATHADFNLDNDLVRFSFMGLQSPPALTPDVMAFIWERAEAAGFVVHNLANYGTVLENLAAADMKEVVSQERQEAESRFQEPQLIPAIDRRIQAPEVYEGVMAQMRGLQKPPVRQNVPETIPE